MPLGAVSRVILIAFLSVAAAGCDRQSDVPAQSRKGELPVRKLAPAGALADPIPVAIPQGEALNSQKVPDNKLPLYELKMDRKELAALERNPESGETHPATFIADGEVYTNVQVRFRGEWARSWPKKPLKIFFSRAQPFQGHHSLNLNSAWRDPAFVRETLAYHVYAACRRPGRAWCACT